MITYRLVHQHWSATKNWFTILQNHYLCTNNPTYLKKQKQKKITYLVSLKSEYQISIQVMSDYSFFSWKHVTTIHFWIISATVPKQFISLSNIFGVSTEHKIMPSNQQDGKACKSWTHTLSLPNTIPKFINHANYIVLHASIPLLD